ncbi:hypothetical protein C1645_767150 [Glomus cerebriforme]|uniref:Uncharacterized protein n=1 Tax=Glomus cerebriforme TaxID=658196 RepID=A0A397T169_9GLOM|nr:hypothetical protein C1645_767150 [Glomus cerebriforme]
MYILAQKLKKFSDQKWSLSSFRQYILFFSFIYFTSVIILLYYIPSAENLDNEPNYNDGSIISNQISQSISRQIPLYTINISNNTVVGSIRISSSKELNKFEISGYLHFTYNKYNILNMKYMLISGESCHNWNNIIQDISSKITFKSRRQGIKIFRKIRETSFVLSNKIESASHFVIIQNSGRIYRQIACTSLNNALKTNTF